MSGFTIGLLVALTVWAVAAILDHLAQKELKRLNALLQVEKDLFFKMNTNVGDK